MEAKESQAIVIGTPSVKRRSPGERQYQDRYAERH